MIRYGLIGAGLMGREHIRNIQLLDDACISAIADPDDPMRERATNLAGPTTQSFTSYHQLLEVDDFDAIVIATPNHTHAQVLSDILDLKRQVPVLVEKPLCINSKQCQAIIAKASQRRQLIWVGMEYRYMPPITRLLEAIGDGEIGALKMVSIREHRYPFLEKVGDWNRFNANTGGTLVEKCCHFFDLFALIADSEPVRIYASAAMNVNHRDERIAGKTPDIIDNAFVIVDFDNGVRAMLDLCMFAEGTVWQEQIKVTGDRQAIELSIPGPEKYSPNSIGRHAQMVTYPRDGSKEVTQVINVDKALLDAGDHHGSSFYQHKRFQELVKSQAKVEIDLYDGLRAVEMGEAAEKSARTGQSVDLTGAVVRDS